jgi:hypothetical protein
MIRRLHVFVLVTTLFSLSGVALVGPRGEVAADSLPKRLSDRTFWQMIVDFSEPGGVFGSDKFLSSGRACQLTGSTSASGRTRISPTLPRCVRASRSSSTSGART